MADLYQIENDVRELKDRNKRVEYDKAWEKSYVRRLLLMVFTYFILSLYMVVVDIDRPWLNSIVPTVGFLLSTLTLPFFKKIWRKYFYKK